MKRFILLFVVLIIAVTIYAEEQKPTISWDNYKKAKAEENYLECARQAEGLKRLDIKAWSLNNAAYVIIKLHMKDKKTADLKSAKQYLDGALEIKEATPECIVKINSNMGYIKAQLKE